MPLIFRKEPVLTSDVNCPHSSGSMNSFTLIVSVKSVTLIRMSDRSVPALVWIFLTSRELTWPRIVTVPIASVMETISMASSLKSLP